MSPSAAVPSAGPLPALVGGALAAAAAASLTWLGHALPLGPWLWQHLPSLPLRPVPVPAACAAALLIGLAAAWVGSAVRPRRRVFALLAAAALLSLSQSLVLALHGVAWDPLPALLALLGAGSLTALLSPAPSGPSNSLRGQVSPALLARLASAENADFLRPDQRLATVLTCQLRHENRLCEQWPARDVLKFRAAFRATASRVLLAHGACLDPSEASAVRAFFGLPLPNPDAAANAASAALALQQALQEFAQTAPLEGAQVAPGIGLATGQLTAGMVGSTYTVFGDALELSRWLASQTAPFEVPILLDSATHFAASNSEDRPLEFVQPPSGGPLEVFQLLGTTGSLSPEALARRQAFRDAIALLRAGHPEDALRRFADARHGLLNPDPPLEYFVSRAAEQAQRAATRAPSAPLPLGADPLPFPRRKPGAARKLPRRP